MCIRDRLDADLAQLDAFGRLVDQQVGTAVCRGQFDNAVAVIGMDGKAEMALVEGGGLLRVAGVEQNFVEHERPLTSKPQSAAKQ